MPKKNFEITISLTKKEINYMIGALTNKADMLDRAGISDEAKIFRKTVEGLKQGQPK